MEANEEPIIFPCLCGRCSSCLAELAEMAEENARLSSNLNDGETYDEELISHIFTITEAL
jgi:hypothetical protein